MPDKFNELLLKQDIIELYNTGITPDYGYLMNGRFEKDMIKTLYPLKTLSGNPISWEASNTEYLFPVVSLEPKQAGSGDPSPENVRPISGYDGVTVNVRGKNLFGGESIEGVIDASNDQLIVGPSMQYPTFITRIIPGKKTYTASRKTTGIIRLGVSPEKPYIGITFSKAVSITGNKLSITAGENDKWLACNVPYYQDDEVQLEEGSTPTPYEPYQGETSTLTLPETIYGGTVDAVTGVGSKTWEFVEFDGTEKWYTWGPNSGADGVTGFFYYYSIDANSLQTRMISNILPYKPAAYGGAVVGCAFGSLGNENPYFIFSVSNSILSDVSSNQAAIKSWKSYLTAQAAAGTPVQVAYNLATPEPFQATGNQALTIQPGNIQYIQTVTTFLYLEKQGG